MARLPRITADGAPHHVILHGHDGARIVLDDADRKAWLALLRDAAATERVALHAWLLLGDHCHLLATPPQAPALSRMMQALARRHAAAFNRRHGRRGTLWNGRFRCALFDPAEWMLDLMRFVEAHPQRTGLVADASDWRWSSLGHHLGQRLDPFIAEPAAYWGLGNTPFEREAAYRRLIDQPLAPARLARITQDTLRGWPLAGADFMALRETLGAAHGTNLPRRRSRGRPATNVAPIR
jgi:putative transposase